MKDQFSRRARRVNEAIADRSKADTSIAQLPNELDKVVHGTAESIEPPDHKCVAVLQLGKTRIQPRAVRFCSRDLLGINVVSIDAEAGQRIDLK